MNKCKKEVFDISDVFEIVQIEYLIICHAQALIIERDNIKKILDKGDDSSVLELRLQCIEKDLEYYQILFKSIGLKF